MIVAIVGFQTLWGVAKGDNFLSHWWRIWGSGLKRGSVGGSTTSGYSIGVA